jgi:2-oxoglutarate dehydrogenase E1 component
MGVMGFEYGYSLDVPDGLTLWEAQFGDFANGAQIIIDQFIVSGEYKWRRLSGLTLLLPHGYEGQGPEHSNARLERFLTLCAEDNIQVCYPTTPAQIFHLLRRQVLRPVRKPLVIMSPKSLLRLPQATSKLDELATGSFQEVIFDKPEIDPAGVTRLLLCTGKVYYDLVKARDERQDKSIAIIRLEQLYPFPQEAIAGLMAKMPKLAELYWVQEEPKNMGAWHFMFPRLHDMVAAQGRVKVGYIGRPEAASPATGFYQTHNIEQQLIVEEAILRGTKNGR